MNRRTLLLALLPVTALAACGEGRPGPVGFGDATRRPGLRAPWVFGDLSQWNGQPAAAARAVASLEHLAHTFATDPFWTPDFPVTTVLQLQKGRDEARAALGIAPRAPGPTVVAALDGLATALERLDRPAADALLAQPPFTLPPAETLRRLASLPRLPEAATAAQMTAADLARSPK